MEARSIKLLFFSLVATCNGFPLHDSFMETKLDGLKEEKVLPNGTVVGQYRYMDKEGNPVQVKYFADDSNYGVELNSVKIIPGNVAEEQPTTTFSLSPLPKEATIPSQENTPEKIPLHNIKVLSNAKKYKSHDPLIEFLTRETAKSNKHRSSPKHSSPDYETYTLNSLEDPLQCKNKLRVYNAEAENRKARNVLDDEFEYTNKECDQLM